MSSVKSDWAKVSYKDHLRRDATSASRGGKRDTLYGCYEHHDDLCQFLNNSAFSNGLSTSRIHPQIFFEVTLRTTVRQRPFHCCRNSVQPAHTQRKKSHCSFPRMCIFGRVWRCAATGTKLGLLCPRCSRCVGMGLSCQRSAPG